MKRKRSGWIYCVFRLCLSSVLPSLLPFVFLPDHFAEIGVLEELVHSIGDGQDQALPAIEKTPPKDVVLQECQLHSRESPPDRRATPFPKGFLGGQDEVLVDLLQNLAQPALREVLDGGFQGYDLPGDGYDVVHRDLRHPVHAPAEEPRDPVGPPPHVPDPSALEKVLPGEAVSRGSPLTYRDGRPDGGLRFRRDPLVGIVDEYSGLAASVYGHLLLGPESFPGIGKYLAAEFFGDLEWPVAASRIDNNDLLCEGDTLQAVWQICGLVLHDGRNGQRYVLIHGSTLGPASTMSVAATKDLVRDGINGFVGDDSANGEAVGKRFARLLNAGTRDRSGRETFRTACGQGWDEVARRQIEIYEGLLGT